MIKLTEVFKLREGQPHDAEIDADLEEAERGTAGGTSSGADVPSYHGAAADARKGAVGKTAADYGAKGASKGLPKDGQRVKVVKSTWMPVSNSEIQLRPGDTGIVAESDPESIWVEITNREVEGLADWDNRVDFLADMYDDGKGGEEAKMLAAFWETFQEA